MFQNQTGANNGVHAGGTPMSPTQQQNMNYNGLPQQQQQQQQQPQQQQSPQHQPQLTKSKGKKPYVKITEQPASKALRFRYECEGRSAGSIPGVNSTSETKTYPTIDIVGYKGRAVVVVSCVTKDPPYRPHPHNLVGKEGCKKGVCTVEINSETMRAVFSNLGIQCVKKKDIDVALKAREEIRVDPFKTGFEHRCQPSSIDLNSVRLCFQVFIESDQKGRFTVPLAPVISDPIFDKKAMSDLVICRLCSCSTTVLGNTQIMLLCEKVAKDDISVRFFEEKNGKVVWEALGEFQQTDVHKQTAITFRTPRYHSMDIKEPAKVFIQLRRPSDGVTSEPLAFEYIPLDSGRTMFWNLHRNLKRKPDLDVFQQILAVDNEKKRALELEPTEVIDLNTPIAEQQPETPSFVSPPVVVQQPTVDETDKKNSEQEIDTIINEKLREFEQQAQQAQPTEAMEQETSELRQISATDKINEWMKSSEFTQQESDQINGVNANTQNNVEPAQKAALNEEDKTLNELLDQVAELDEIYADHVLQRENYNSEILNEMNSMEVNASFDVDEPGKSRHLAKMETDDSFDDAATYTSLQIAFKNPITIPMDDLMPPTPPASHLAPEDVLLYDHVDVLSSPKTNPIQNTVPSRPTSLKSVNSPHMHVTAAEEEKLPPLPPKRLRKQDSNAENQSIEANTNTNTSTLDRKSRQQQSPIIIMKTPDQSPPTKRLPPKPGSSNSNTLPKQKKPGFFSKLFSRGKSKSDLSRDGQTSAAGSKYGSKVATPIGSREPSIGHFQMNDSNRASLRSAKSLQPGAVQANIGKNSAPKTGKPVGRSVSSVSGKRPTRITADVVHIPLKGESVSSLPQNEAYSNSSTVTLGALDRRTVSALQLAEIPISDGNMELVAIADRQSLRNLCQGEFNVQLDPDVDLTEAEHFALYTSIPPQASVSEFDETSAYYAPVDAGEILTPDEIAKRLAAANRIN